MHLARRLHESRGRRRPGSVGRADAVADLSDRLRKARDRIDRWRERPPIRMRPWTAYGIDARGEASWRTSPCSSRSACVRTGVGRRSASPGA